MCPPAMHQMMRLTDICYVASCVASCAESCVNASQTNCSVNCCNSTGCLNATFASMMMTTTTGKLLTLTIAFYLSPSHCPWLCFILRVMTACLQACTISPRSGVLFILYAVPRLILDMARTTTVATTPATTTTTTAATTTMASSTPPIADNVRTKGLHVWVCADIWMMRDQSAKKRNSFNSAAESQLANSQWM